MRTWRRVKTPTLCGYCRNRTISTGEPAIFIQLSGVKRETVRCQDCAGEAPPDLPPLEGRIEPQRFTKKFTPIAKVAREWLPHPDD